MHLSPETLGKIAWSMAAAVGKTLSITEHGCKEDFFSQSGAQVIFALWHGRLFFPMFCRRNLGIYVLVSEHRDGDIITASLDAAGFRTVRGSTTRGGAKALVQLVKLVREGAKVAFTPDGPRGPRWKFQPGAVYLAAKTGLPVVPITGSARRAFYFKSWDSLQFPVPFSKGVLNIGEPYRVTGGLDEENIEYHRAELERRLVALACEADRLAGAPEGK
ncbi:MAG: lysophospholipid acyltransferase family protein [Candidatus Latescibacterota bacterium]